VGLFSSSKKKLSEDNIFLRPGCLQVGVTATGQYGRINFNRQVEIWAVSVGGPVSGGAANITVWFDDADQTYLPVNSPYVIESVTNVNAATALCTPVLRFPTNVNVTNSMNFPRPILTRTLSAGSTQTVVQFFVNFLYRECNTD
jgi:hypothetical protein